jgi:hypothetical protein
MGRDRSPPDGTARDPPADARVCVVATQADTFARCRDGLYPVPRSYDRAREPFGYMAFYRTAPTSAITHYAAVTDRIEQSRGEPGVLEPTDWAKLVDPFADAETVVVFTLGELRELDRPVTNDITGVRGAWYCTVGDLRAAKTLSGLSDRSA